MITVAGKYNFEFIFTSVSCSSEVRTKFSNLALTH